jgi:hypothetical protein
MLTGVSQVRRTADLLTSSVLPRPAPFAPAAPWVAAFDGTLASFNRWHRVSPAASSGFTLVNGEIMTYGDGDFGLLYYAAPALTDFTLKVQFRVFDPQNHNSGIFVRFANPLLDPTPITLSRMQNESQREKQLRSDLLSDQELFRPNRAWSSVYSGFELQIDDNARGDPRKDFYGVPEDQLDSTGGLRKNRTGAIYKIPAADPIPNSANFDARLQDYQPPPRLVPMTWYEFTIDIRGNNYAVDLTNLDTSQTVRTTTFQNTDPDRGAPPAGGRPGYIGLQSYPNSPLAYRNIQYRP